MARFREIGIIALGWWLSSACCGATSSMQQATSKQPREGSVLVALLRAGYGVVLAFDELPGNIDDRPTTRLSWGGDFTDVRTVRRLLKKGVDVNARDERGATALLYAVCHASHSVIAELLHRGANVNIADRWGETPLMLAVHHDERDGRLVSLFLKHGAKVNARTQY